MSQRGRNVVGVGIFLLVFVGLSGSVLAQQPAGGDIDAMDGNSVGGLLTYEMVSGTPAIGLDGRFGFGVGETTAFVLNPAVSRYLNVVVDDSMGNPWTAATGLVQVDVNGLMRFDAFWPGFGYAGGGLGLLTWRTPDTGFNDSGDDRVLNWGLNVVTGGEVKLDMPVTPYLQARITWMPVDYHITRAAMSLQVGVNYDLGR